MIFNENGEILNNNFILMNESYKLDLIINEGFSDMARKVKSKAVELVRKMIDGIQSSIEWWSRLRFKDKINKVTTALEGKSEIKFKISEKI